MRVLLVGASGPIGSPLARRLGRDGHDLLAVVAPRSDKTSGFDDPAVAVDLLDLAALQHQLRRSAPDAVFVFTDETAAPPADCGSILRDRGRVKRATRFYNDVAPLLVNSALQGGCRRIIAGSHTATFNPGSTVRREIDVMWRDGPGLLGQLARATERFEEAANAVGGVILRFATPTGPGTDYAPDGTDVTAITRGRFVLPQDARGYSSFVHVRDAVNASIAALDAPKGVYHIVGDSVQARVWVPTVAKYLRVGPPKTANQLYFSGPLRMRKHILTASPPVAGDQTYKKLGWSPTLPSWEQQVLTPL
ncbi:MAG: NAD(P)-dependent oxidoreductase [Acidimicrobiia bacterium]|nr:NAD(P)-dependent oxidoreductase [Acidimicrobiia bacterium]